MRLSAGRLGVLAERDFRFVFLAGAVSQVGDQMMPVAIAFAVLDLTGSAADLGYVLAAGTAPLVVLLLVGGVFADRFSRRRLMFSADVVRLATDGTLAALLLSGHARLWHLVALQAVHGAASAFFGPASSGIVPQIVPEGRFQQANALRGMTMSVGGIVGPAIAGALVATAGSGWAVAGNAATFAVSALFLFRVHAPALERAAERPTFLGDLLHGWREFKSRTWLWTIVAQFSLIHLAAIAPFFALGAVIAKRSLGGAGAWSLILAVFAAGTLAELIDAHGVDISPELAEVGRVGYFAASLVLPGPTLRLAGELDFACADALAGVLDAHYHGTLRLDLADLGYVDVAGLRALRGKRGQRLTITSASQPMRRLLVLLGWDTDPGIEIAEAA